MKLNAIVACLLFAAGSAQAAYTFKVPVEKLKSEVPSEKGCTTPWGSSLASKSSVISYFAATVPAGQECQQGMWSCNNGVITGSGNFATCQVLAPSSCNLPWGGALASGASVTAYAQDSVAYGSLCTSSQRTCNNGVLSGTGAFKDCEVQQPKTCTTPWGATVAHNASVPAYAAAEAETCTPESRVCNNGTLSGTGTFQSCTQAIVVKDFGSYRAWSDGTTAASCLAYKNGGGGKAYSGATGNGVYRITVNGAVKNVLCDMTTSGGGWTLGISIAGGGQSHWLTTAASANPPTSVGDGNRLSDTEIASLQTQDYWMFQCKSDLFFVKNSTGVWSSNFGGHLKNSLTWSLDKQRDGIWDATSAGGSTVFAFANSGYLAYGYPSTYGCNNDYYAAGVHAWSNPGALWVR